MEKNELYKLHSLHLVLANEVRRICEKHNIKYFMIAGTLLGAIRHQGFIPWDDDMDIGMLRIDYEKFINACEKELDRNKFYLQNDKMDRNYTYNFAKLRLNGTEIIEEFSLDVETHQGIYIDIFPFDNVPDNRVKRFIQYKEFWFLKNLLWIKCGYGDKYIKKQLSFKIAKCLVKLFSIEFLKLKKYNVITRYENEKTTFVVAGEGAYGLKKETIQRNWIEILTEYNFETEKYFGISDYNGYLSYFYGDYMTLPPKDKRNHHQRIRINYGDYFKGDI